MSSCIECKSSLCRFCVWTQTEESGSRQSTFCLDCERHSLGVREGEGKQLTEQEMCAFLKARAVNVTAGTTYAEVLKLFNHYDEDKDAMFTEDIASVRYPVLSTSSLNTMHESYNIIKRLKTVEMKKIGDLISDLEVDALSVLGLV